MRIVTFSILAFSMVNLWAEENVGDLLQKTIQDREQEVSALASALKEARKIEKPEKITEPVMRLESELNRLPTSLQSTEVAQNARTFLCSIYIVLGEQAIAKNQWNQARNCALTALRFVPGDNQASQLFSEVDEVLRRGSVGKQKMNPVLNDSFFGKLGKVDEKLQKAESLRETGQLDEADQMLQEVLRIDPYNHAAIASLSKIQSEKLLVSEKRRDVAFQEKKTEVRQLWDNLRDPRTKTPESDVLNAGKYEKGPSETIPARMANYTNLTVDFVNMDLESLRQSLNALAAQEPGLSEQKKRLYFSISSELAAQQTTPVTLKLRNANFEEVLRYVTQIAGIKARFTEIGVILGPLVEQGEIVSRDYLRVSPSFFFGENKSESAEDGGGKIRGGTGLSSKIAEKNAANQLSAQDYLKKLGVDFSNPKAFAIYNSTLKKLQVANTPEMCDLIGNLIAAAQEDTLLIRIDCRLVEINQNDLGSLTVNTTLGGQQSSVFNPFPQGLIPSSSGATPPPSSQQGVTMQLNQVQGVGLLPNNTIQSFLAPGVLAGPNQSSSYDLNTMQLGGSIMGATQFRTLITAISQKSSANVLASPSIVLKRGQKGTIEVSQEFRFVKEYNDPQSSIRTFLPFGGAAGVGGIVTPIPGPETVISAFPSQISDPEPIGVKMGVKPDVTANNKRVLLELEPSFVDFEGFINYGALVNSAYAATYFGQATTILTNNIQQPVFIRRDLVIPPVEVNDGWTLTLGGLLREDIQTIDEKVPIFGDIPFLGKAFQGKTEQAIKKNTLIFVTPRILRTDGNPLNSSAGSDDAMAALDDRVYAPPPSSN